MPTLKNIQHKKASPPSAQQGSSSEVCSDVVMDCVPLVARFIRAHIRSDDSDISSLAQIRVLYFLNTSPGASLSEVATFLTVTKATASNMIGRMVDKGLVQRCDDPEERRCVNLTITAEGLKHYEKWRRKAQTAVSEVLDNLAPAERATVTEGLRILQEAFSR